MEWQESPVVGADAYGDPYDENFAAVRAAYMLRVSGRMIGLEDDLIESESFPTPSVEAVDRGTLDLEELLANIGIDLDSHEHGERDPAMAAEVASAIGADLIHDGGPATTVGALVEAELHSEHEVVRVAAAISALDTTGPRPRLELTLVEALQSEDVDIVDMAATGLARIDPTHEALGHLRGDQRRDRATDEEHETLVMTHGTWSSASAWYQPGGDFYDFVAPNRADLFAPSFTWTGDYSDTQRHDDAVELVNWLASQGLAAPAFMAHSHGATVANLATQLGQPFDKLFLLSWPVHDQWGPDPANINQVVDIRVKMDLVIMADRGGQRIRNAGYPVDEHRAGWFAHSASHDPAYWNKHGLLAVL